MNRAVKSLVIVLGVLLILVSAGCPKKKVVTEVTPPPPPPETVTEQPVEQPPVTLDLKNIYFDFDKSDIRPGDAQILQENADKIKRAGDRVTVTIEGHCDPIGTSEYNMALGMRRAEAAKAYLVNLGVPATGLTTISYGEERLVTQNEAEYQLNRRAEFKPAR